MKVFFRTQTGKGFAQLKAKAATEAVYEMRTKSYLKVNTNLSIRKGKQYCVANQDFELENINLKLYIRKGQEILIFE